MGLTHIQVVRKRNLSNLQIASVTPTTLVYIHPSIRFLLIILLEVGLYNIK